jgi:hypothetical protein
MIDNRDGTQNKLFEINVINPTGVEIEKQERAYVNISQTKVGMENYVVVSGNVEENNLKLTVVSVYDFSNIKASPDPLEIESEIDVWRQKLLADIENNSEMLRKALWVASRG